MLELFWFRSGSDSGSDVGGSDSVAVEGLSGDCPKKAELFVSGMGGGGKWQSYDDHDHYDEEPSLLKLHCYC